MANISEIDNFDANIYQLETTDPVEGGPGGIANTQAQALANRTLWLKNRVESVWLPGDIKEIDCDDAYIAANFVTSGPTEGLGLNERLGWAICNGKNGTVNRNGRVGVAWGSIYSAMGALIGSQNNALIQANLPQNFKTIHTEMAGTTAAGGTGREPWFPTTVNFGGSSQPFSIMQPGVVSLFIMKLP